MVQQITDKFWQAEARSEETKQFIQDIKRITRHKFTAEEKIRIVLEGFRRDTPIRDLCRREGIHPGTYYAWLKDFMEAGKERLVRNNIRDATRAEVQDIKRENARLKQLVAELSLQVHVLKKRQYRVWNKGELYPDER
jgi:transposase